MRTFSSHKLIAALLLVAAADCRDDNTGTTPQDLSETPDMAQTTQPDLASVDLSTQDLLMARDPVELMVVRVGDGTAALTSAATAVFIERRKIADGAIVGSPIALPTVLNGTSRRLTLGGSTVSEGALSRSANGAYVLIAGYDAMLGTTSASGPVGGSASSAVNRVIGRIGTDNSVDTTTALDALTGQSVRGAASTDGLALWASAGNGIAYTTRGSTAAPTVLNTTNMRVLGIFGGQLYATSGSGTNIGVNSVGTGTPMAAGTTLTLLPGFSTQMNSPSPYGFVAFDRDSTPGIDTLYVADDRSGGGGGVQRWNLMAGTWTLAGTFTVGTGTVARAVTGYMSGANVVLLAVIPEAGTAAARVVSFTDSGNTPGVVTAKDLATAGNNTTFRGIALAPE